MSFDLPDYAHFGIFENFSMDSSSNRFNILFALFLTELISVFNFMERIAC